LHMLQAMLLLQVNMLAVVETRILQQIGFILQLTQTLQQQVV